MIQYDFLFTDEGICKNIRIFSILAKKSKNIIIYNIKNTIALNTEVLKKFKESYSNIYFDIDDSSIPVVLNKCINEINDLNPENEITIDNVLIFTNSSFVYDGATTLNIKCELVNNTKDIITKINSLFP